MVPISRRRLLAAAAAAGATAVAGCSSFTGGSGSASVTGVADAGPISGDADLPPYAYLRHDEFEPVVRHVDESPDDSRDFYPRPFLVDSAERAGEFEYRDVDGVEAVRAFVDDTDFDEACVYVDQREVQACYRLDLCGASWSSTDVDLEYGRVPLPYTYACEADAKVTEARFIRLPDPLSDEDVNSMGSSTGGGACPNAPEPVAGSDVPGTDGTTTARAEPTTDEPTTTGGDE
jgi:hypothetical protein